MLTSLEIEDFGITDLETLVFRHGVKSKQLIISTNARYPNVAHIKTLTEDVEKLNKAILKKQGDG